MKRDFDEAACYRLLDKGEICCPYCGSRNVRFSAVNGSSTAPRHGRLWVHQPWDCLECRSPFTLAFLLKIIINDTSEGSQEVFRYS